MLACLEAQVDKANQAKKDHILHKQSVEQKVKEIRGQLKAQQQLADGPDDPDSRMEMDRDRRDKKAAKSKRFWPK